MAVRRPLWQRLVLLFMPHVLRGHPDDCCWVGDCRGYCPHHKMSLRFDRLQARRDFPRARVLP